MTSSDRPPSPPSSPRSSTHADTLTHVTALARFEFEPLRGNDGTKVLMVEWQDDLSATTRGKQGTWTVSWPGKKTVFPADDVSVDGIRRVYFLLPPGAMVPPYVVLSHSSQSENKDSRRAREKEEPLRMTINALPAIFTPELGATAKTSGKKGVLHTIWAKKRLQVLTREIKAEEALNLEGIALEMARAEKSWIEVNFGLSGPHQRPAGLDLSAVRSGSGSGSESGQLSPGLTSPKSPGGRRLSEKLKGLSLGTSEKELDNGLNTPIRDVHPLSPEASDVAESSFSAFRNGPSGTGSGSASASSAKKMVAQLPPDSIRKQQQCSSSQNTASLNSVASRTQPKNQAHGSTDEPAEDDLFAVALSPRSPDGPKSPFSISSAEVGAFAKSRDGTGARSGGGAEGKGAFAKIKGEQ